MPRYAFDNHGLLVIQSNWGACFGFSQTEGSKEVELTIKSVSEMGEAFFEDMSAYTEYECKLSGIDTITNWKTIK